MMNAPGKQFYDTQIAFLEAGDLDGLMSQYHEDTILVGFDLTVRGREALRKHMEGYLARLGSFKLKSTDKFTETGDSIFFEATVLTDLGEARVYDVFMLKDGRATHQFTGLISLAPLPPK
jgi:ketosteroid isomerase-like protein